MENNGWVKLHRKFQSWEWSDNPNMVCLFVHLLLLANHAEKKWHGHTVKPGQLITGLHSLSELTGISPQSLRTCLERLKSTGEITSQSTNRFRLITIIKWADYQGKEDTPTSRSTSKLTNNQQAINKQLTTNKNVKNDKNEKKATILQTASAEHGGIVEVINIFKQLNPLISFSNKTYRKAAQTLIIQYGVEKVVSAATYALSIQGEKFAPTITNPDQLNRKFPELIIYKKKSQSNSIAIIE